MLIRKKSLITLILCLIIFNTIGLGQADKSGDTLPKAYPVQVTMVVPDTLKNALVELSKNYTDNLRKDGMSMKEYIPVTISIIALAISCLLYFLTKQMTLKTNAIPVIIDMFREWRTEKTGVIASYYAIRSFTEQEKENPENLTFKQIPNEEKKCHAVRVSHYFDNLGLLIYSGVLEPKHVISFVGANAYNSWIILKPYIMAERERRKTETNDDPHYQRHFEYFVALYLDNMKKINSELAEKTIWIKKIFAENEPHKEQMTDETTANSGFTSAGATE